MFERIFMFINDSSYIILDNERLNLSVNRWTPYQNPFRGNVFKISVYTTPKLLLSNSAFFILASEDIHNLNQSMFFFSMTDLSYLKKDLNSLGFPFSNVNVSIHSRTKKKKKKKKVIILGSGFPYPLHSVKSCASQALPSCSFYVPLYYYTISINNTIYYFNPLFHYITISQTIPSVASLLPPLCLRFWSPFS